MKKVLILSLFVMAALVSQAWAKNMCLYASGDCWPQGTGTCEGGWVYDGGTEGKGTLCSGGTYIEKGPLTTGDPPTGTKDPIGCCNWNNNGCFPIFTEAEKSNCTSGGFDLYDSCPGDEAGTCEGGFQNGPYCYWALSDYNDKCYCGVVDGAAATAANCTDDSGEIVTSCDGKCGSTPVIKFTPASKSLTVAPYARSLHISSAKEATVSLYDMNGAKVYSGKVRAGNSVFSLEKVASGSYYAVVQSGSDAKKVPVILK